MKLSNTTGIEMKDDDETINQICAIYDWLALKTTIEQGGNNNDAANEEEEEEAVVVMLLFGGATMSIPHKGVALYQKGMRVFSTGNCGTFGNPLWKNQPTALLYRDYMLENLAGVDGDKIVPLFTDNTLQDVTQSIEYMKQNSLLSLSSQKSSVTFVLLSHAVHQRRAVATFQKHYFDWVNNHNVVTKIESIPADDPHPRNMANNDLLKEMAQRCVSELERLEKYGSKGDLQIQMVPTYIQKAWNGLQLKLDGS